MAKEISAEDLEKIEEVKTKLFKELLTMEPPECNGEEILAKWESIYDNDIKTVVVNTEKGPSNDTDNKVFPYEKLYAVIGDGGNWKWPRMWQKFDELERRGPAFRAGEKLNFNQPNKNPNMVAQNVLIVGGGPVGLRLGIELALGGHKVTQYEKRREIKNADGGLASLGFTNRINRPHMWPFVRNDLARLNGRDFLSTAAAYPVFTEPDTSSMGIDELQLLLMKSALPLGVDFRLGVGFDDAKVQIDAKSSKPTWNVECSADDSAAEKYGMEKGKNVVNFDCLVGCDGPRSAVRATQGSYFGDIERRKFMDCVGIVVNVRKVSRARLKEMGFPYGQEPKDMNRTTMVFRDFFGKIKEEADADLENFIYYKASHHYYVIITPKRANLIKHGLSGKVYHFEQARTAPGANEEKAKLKKYCAAVLKAAGIPMDEQLPNDGFVDAPNDCMAFDFAECWNTKKSMSFSLPPTDYDVAEHGKWRGKKLYPFVALAGDALLEPFWPMGLGLKRGWQAIMDTCYGIDNLYNREMFADKLEKEPDEVSWDDHYTALEEANNQNFEFCNRLKVSSALGKGEFEDKSNVSIQLHKKLKDAMKPAYEIEIDPASRYEPLNVPAESKYARDFLNDDKCLHPIAAKEIAKAEYLHEVSKKGGGATGQIEREGKPLVSINGMTPAAKDVGGYVFRAPPRKSLVGMTAVVPDAKKDVPHEEIKKKSTQLQESLMTAMLARQVDDHVNKGRTTRGSTGGENHGNGAMASASTRDEVGHMPPTGSVDMGVAASSEAMWHRMQGKHLSPAQTAELEHIRNMITALTGSLESYKKAEKELMMK